MKRIKKTLSRRNFMKTGAFVASAAAGTSLMGEDNPELLKKRIGKAGVWHANHER